MDARDKRDHVMHVCVTTWSNENNDNREICLHQTHNRLSTHTNVPQYPPEIIFIKSKHSKTIINDKWNKMVNIPPADVSPSAE